MHPQPREKRKRDTSLQADRPATIVASNQASSAFQTRITEPTDATRLSHCGNANIEQLRFALMSCAPFLAVRDALHLRCTSQTMRCLVNKMPLSDLTNAVDSRLAVLALRGSCALKLDLQASRRETAPQVLLSYNLPLLPEDEPSPDIELAEAFETLSGLQGLCISKEWMDWHESSIRCLESETASTEEMHRTGLRDGSDR